MKKAFLFVSLVVLLHASLSAQEAIAVKQDTLPKFSLVNTGNNRVVISWTHNYPVIKQISIQRSFDSLSNYKTILNVADPMAVQNGYMDTRAANDHMFYRIYIQLDNGVYLFSKAKKPIVDTISAKTAAVKRGRADTVIQNGQMFITKIDTVMMNGRPTIVKAQPIVIKIDSLQWGDSVATPNPNYNKPRVTAFTPSLYVFTNRDGYVRINLPDDEKAKKYSIKFFDDKNTFLFELKEIKERDFKLDKTNFYHAGWFFFELYEGSKLIEKHKFYLEKDF